MRERRHWFVDMSNPMRILEDDVRKTIICEIPAAASNAEARADAKLIAAAPHLLEALQEAIVWWDDRKPDYEPTGDDPIAPWRMAIFKAGK